MKYNVGDKVINIGCIDYATNVYHYKNQLMGLVRTVVCANEDEFSIYENGLGSTAGCDSYKHFSQLTGFSRSFPNPDRLLHLEKDHDEIEKIINDFFDKEYKKTENRRIEKIKEIESRIEKLKKDLHIFENKNQSDIFGNPAFQWIEDRKKQVFSIIKGE